MDKSVNTFMQAIHNNVSQIYKNMSNQTEYKERLKQFNKSRTDFEHQVQDVADKLELSRRRLYMILKYPNENPEKYQELCDYVKSAGFPFQETEVSKIEPSTAEV